VPHFWTCAGPTGSGKTRAATTFACERFSGSKDRIRTIVTTRRGSDDKVAHRITDYLKGRNEAGDLLYVTHAGFLRTPHWHRADTWNLFVDEAMEVTYHNPTPLFISQMDVPL
jgi:hypothetical protein